MNTKIPRTALVAALAILGTRQAGAQDAPPAAATRGPAASVAPADALPADPTIAPWAPPGGHEATLASPERCRPMYPAEAVRANAQGTTTVMFTVGPDAKIVNGAVLRSSGDGRIHKELDRVTFQTLAACSFNAGVDAQGRPTTTRLRVDYTWKIE